MQRAQIEEKVKEIVSEQLDVTIDKIKDESSFQDDLGADSLDIVELVMSLEEAFECEIPDDEAEKISTVKQAIDYIVEHQ
ncbi:MAG: acyl carrier protein [Francisella sp.]|jgi:acyl carrier protein|nr:MAG: acyl carrier protein [Francisella sp.]